jgi:hypothetical protein
MKIGRGTARLVAELVQARAWRSRTTKEPTSIVCLWVEAEENPKAARTRPHSKAHRARRAVRLHACLVIRIPAEAGTTNVTPCDGGYGPACGASCGPVCGDLCPFSSRP